MSNNDNKHNWIDVVRPPTRTLERETRAVIARNITPPTPPPTPPINRATLVPNTPPPGPPRVARAWPHKSLWNWIKRHPWISGIAGFFIVGYLITDVFPALGTVLAAHPVLKTQALVIGCFWVLAIGTIPIVAVVRTMGNVARKIHDVVE